MPPAKAKVHYGRLVAHSHHPFPLAILLRRPALRRRRRYTRQTRNRDHHLAAGLPHSDLPPPDVLANLPRNMVVKLPLIRSLVRDDNGGEVRFYRHDLPDPGDSPVPIVLGQTDSRVGPWSNSETRARRLCFSQIASVRVCCSGCFFLICVPPRHLGAATFYPNG